MNIEQEIINIKSKLDNLQASFIQSQQNSVKVTANADAGGSLPQIVSENTQNITDNSDAIFELAEIIGEMG